MKKIFVLFFLIFSFFSTSGVFAETTQQRLQRTKETRTRAAKQISNAKTKEAKKAAQEKYDSASKAYNDAKQQAKKEYEEECAASGECLEQPTWTLDVGSFTPGNTFSTEDTEARADYLFSSIIKSLMMALGVLSVFMMTIGGGYMILHNGQDELLNKGKSIFMAGIYAMIIALMAYILIEIVTNILYG